MIVGKPGTFGASVCCAYFAVGLGLFEFTRRMAQLCMGDNGCADKPDFVVWVFELEFIYWLLPAALATLSILLLAGRVTRRASIALNVLLSVVLIVWIAHVLDLLLGQIFCHEWGCSFLLPTWALFERP